MLNLILTCKLQLYTNCNMASIFVSDKLPTSTLLELKVGDLINNNQDLSGTIQKIKISETDEFLMFCFVLAHGEIEVKKLKQVC
ncbi:hypothetical protein [Pedobacter zeae]|uniref:Uncharacterized protein n=1 Tax=Pedobacter zeae TaxID=1737356 RepID=A0A7W6P4G8_9SPHI|nr:hypothetical protein [Pedobacter zeae]MBB4106912.1 hypothetical protein [Pedobacter zeae]GGH04522.1 hypothetical protein GCM10007422_20170 [Pedobacter zeae]